MTAIAQAETLIPVIEGEIGGELQSCVDARTLHRWLKNGERFATWIKKRIRTYGFIENEDYAILISANTEIKSHGGNRRGIEYLLTLDTAKELSMVENNAQGRMARRYFINCEKAMRQLENSLMLQFNRALVELEKFTDMASQAGRTLSVVGKQVKPACKKRVELIRARLQPTLPNMEIQ